MAGLKVYQLTTQGTLLGTDWLVIQRGTDPAKKTPLTEILSNGLYHLGVQKLETNVLGAKINGSFLEINGGSTFPTMKIHAPSATSRFLSLGMLNATDCFIEANGSATVFIIKAVGVERFRANSEGGVTTGISEADNFKATAMPTVGTGASGTFWNDGGTVKIIA